MVPDLTSAATALVISVTLFGAFRYARSRTPETDRGMRSAARAAYRPTIYLAGVVLVAATIVAVGDWRWLTGLGLRHGARLALVLGTFIVVPGVVRQWLDTRQWSMGGLALVFSLLGLRLLVETIQELAKSS